MRVNNDINSSPRRSSGILLPISSLPGPYGIGDLGPSAFSFIDFLSRAGQKYWQILPVGPTSPIFGNSPYMSFSALGGNPLLLSPELLVRQTLLHESELPTADFSPYTIDYDRVLPIRKTLLRLAWQRFQGRGDRAVLEKFKKNNPWVHDHALFLALKKKYKHTPWYKWPKDIRFREGSALKQATIELADDLACAVFVQYLFFRQWDRLHGYAQDHDIHIIGDLPIYVALDSVDVWANQEIFELNEKSGRPKAVAGVPPDYFSATGQLWGNPLYRWNSRSNAVKDHLYDWWQQRLTSIYTMVDMIRIDHFRGFESYWSVPAREKTAIHGSWKKGPGLRFFREMERRLGPMPIIAEDLGIITPAVEKLRDALGYPGMKILLFAFDGTPDNSYLPQNFTNNCVVYTGTHDNDTAVGWYLRPDIRPEVRRQAKRQANQFNDDASTFHRDLIYLAHSSVAGISIIPMQDLLGFGNDCRMNTPGTRDNNWQWRCAGRFITDDLADWFGDVTAFFGRLNTIPAPNTPAPSTTGP
jgi:4-alpha-glucanotransferase